MARPETEGEYIHGWPDRARSRSLVSTDAEGRTIYARSPLLELQGLVTPTDATYVVAQLNMCDPIYPDDYTVRITGMVDKPCELSLRDLQLLPSRTVRCVMECAGDDGEYFLWQQGKVKKPSRLARQSTEGGWNQMNGADSKSGIEEILDAIPTTCLVSGGEWTGVSLRDVLEMVGLREGVESVYVKGHDTGRPDPTAQYLSTGRTDIDVVDPGVINYDKALPLEKALDPDTLLVWAHNGEYLRHVHGAPLRLIVPGWSGNWSVKWIQEISLLSSTPPCYYQTHYFVLADTPESKDRRPCMELGCKSVILNPIDEDSPLSQGDHLVSGLAWSGLGAVTAVDVSFDDGATWHPARVEEHADRWLWRRWTFVWRGAQPGKYRIISRASDEAGRVQPQTRPNFQNKHFDGFAPVEVEIC